MTTLTKSLLKAKHLGTREAKIHLSRHMKSTHPYIITVYGEPKKIVIEYDDMMDLLDRVEEIQDKVLMTDIAGVRDAYQKNPDKGISAEHFFKQW